MLYAGSNILLTLTCRCSSVIVCTCYGIDGRGGGTAILSDFDLVEKATSDGKWARLRDSEPAGTRGMKAPEVNKELIISIVIEIIIIGLLYIVRNVIKHVNYTCY